MHNSIWNAEKSNKKPYVYDDYYNPLKMKCAHTELMRDRGYKSTLKILRLHKIVTMWNLTCFTKETLKRCFILRQIFGFHNYSYEQTYKSFELILKYYNFRHISWLDKIRKWESIAKNIPLMVKLAFWHVPASHLRAATKNITWIDWNSLLKLAI